MSQDTPKEAEVPEGQRSPPGPTTPHKFTPHDLKDIPTTPCGLRPSLWSIVQSTPANFPSECFLEVGHNLLENPNLTASHLARAELSYQSFNDATFNPKATASEEVASIVKHLRPECRPQLVEAGVEGFELESTVVRKLIPRNPKLDDALMQTCHTFTSRQSIEVTNRDGEVETIKNAERSMIVYIPHVDSAEQIPFYHPKVHSLAILYTFNPDYDASTSKLPAAGELSIYYRLFDDVPLDNRLSRTGLKLLEIIHKHSRGRQSGYKKRVHHDQVVGQKKFQDTYAYLKGKYAKRLIEGWVEKTPPEKHVFEDLGIAAFLMELWVDMYGQKEESQPQGTAPPKPDNKDDGSATQTTHQAQANFPGFVDIGCGNGLLVHILTAEGYRGWGFDARRRKSWSTFPPAHTALLHELLLVPHILDSPEQQQEEQASTPPLSNGPPSHNGVFPKGTFIISNHADELTAWTPLLASLSDSPFIAIPCCSHDFGGTRFRAPPHAKFITPDPNEKDVKGRVPSAYASLCSWVSYLTERAGYVPEKEFLRIPSTRNMAVLGRRRATGGDGAEEGLEERLRFAREVVEREMGGATSIEQVRMLWMKSGGALAKPGKGGH